MKSLPFKVQRKHRRVKIPQHRQQKIHNQGQQSNRQKIHPNPLRHHIRNPQITRTKNHCIRRRSHRQHKGTRSCHRSRYHEHIRMYAERECHRCKHGQKHRSRSKIRGDFGKKIDRSNDKYHQDKQVNALQQSDLSTEPFCQST